MRHHQPFDRDVLREYLASAARAAEDGRPGDAAMLRQELAEAIQAWPDLDLLVAHQRASEKLGNPEADALRAEVTRRGLNP